jgi:hypothetical protein
MNTTPPFILATPRVRRKRRTDAATPGPVALVLVAAEYFDGETVWLTFDRAVDIAAVVPSAIVVNDAVTAGGKYAGYAAALTGPAVVEVSLEFVEAITGTDIRLDAGPGTGIVAADDGGTWAGADVVLPFPP